MKKFLPALLLCVIGFNSFAQKDSLVSFINVDTIAIDLTEWQVAQFKKLQDAKRIIEDQSMLLIQAVIDSRGVKLDDVLDYRAAGNRLVLVRRRPKKQMP